MKKNTEYLKARISAYFIDYFLILLIFATSLFFFTFLMFFFLNVETPEDGLVGGPTTDFLFVNIVMAISTLGYFTISEALISTTAGKKLNIIDTCDEAETRSKITPKQALIRNLLKIRPELLVVDLLIGFYMRPTSNQRASEILSKTTVTKSSGFKGFTTRENQTNRRKNMGRPGRTYF